MPLARVKILANVPGQQPEQVAFKAGDYYLVDVHQAEALIVAGQAALDDVPREQSEGGLLVDPALLDKLEDSLKFAQAKGELMRAKSTRASLLAELARAKADVVAAQARVASVQARVDALPEAAAEDAQKPAPSDDKVG